MRRLLLLGTFLGVLTASAEALTIRDIIELSKAGLSDEVLLALIEVDRRVYPVDAATLKELKAGGVSDRVVVALVRSGRIPPFEAPPAELPAPLEIEAAVQRPVDPPPPQVVVIDHHDPVERVREVPVAVPVYVPILPRGRHRSVQPASDYSTFVPFQSGPPRAQPAVPRAQEPVYWGWGGRRRPDSWQPAPSEVKPPPPPVRPPDGAR